MNDTANSRALSRSRLGLSRELQQDRTDLPPDPSIGGTRGYPLWFRMRVLSTAADMGVEAAAEQWGCCLKSIYSNWQERVQPYRMTGGAERSVITGYDQLLTMKRFLCGMALQLMTLLMSSRPSKVGQVKMFITLLLVHLTDLRLLQLNTFFAS